MITVSRTPLRVSFFGGGTDYPEYFERARGAVLGMAIDKYIYISVLRLSSVIDYHFRVSYSRIETVLQASELQHPVVRHVLQHFAVTEPLDLSIMADLPARSGLGSSSSFTVAPGKRRGTSAFTAEAVSGPTRTPGTNTKSLACPITNDGAANRKQTIAKRITRYKSEA